MFQIESSRYLGIFPRATSWLDPIGSIIYDPTIYPSPVQIIKTPVAPSKTPTKISNPDDKEIAKLQAKNNDK